MDLKKRILPLLLALLLLAGCGAGQTAAPNSPKRYEASYLTLFDTVTTIVGYSDREEDFRAAAQAIHDDMLTYHQFYDIYNDYEGLNNLKTINDNAGVAPVQVDQKIIDLLLFCKELYTVTDGKVNVAMGSVLSLWHDARTLGIEDPDSAALPHHDALLEADRHTSFEGVVIDEQASTVYLSDPAQRLDVGAVAKGYAVERVCEAAPKGLLISVGGNVRATGPKPLDDAPWVVGVQNPEGDKSDYLHTIYVKDVSVVTSGDYQRYYTVDGVAYHHIIDPATLYPAKLWKAVTVLCPDSGLADGLSTALFTLPQAEGQALLDRFEAQAMWVDLEGNLLYSPGFQDYIRT